jgi:hypothetical protein
LKEHLRPDIDNDNKIGEMEREWTDMAAREDDPIAASKHFGKLMYEHVSVIRDD